MTGLMMQNTNFSKLRCASGVSKLSSRKRIFLSATLAATLCQPYAGKAEDWGIFNRADEIYSRNDCSDRANEDCREMFENTCAWAGDSAVMALEGVQRSVPYDRVDTKLWGELGEVAIGSGGYIDPELAVSMLDALAEYFVLGHYQREFSNFHDRAGLALGMMAGSALTGNTTAKDIEETKQLLAQKRDAALRNKWYKICMNSAYFDW